MSDFASPPLVSGEAGIRPVASLDFARDERPLGRELVAIDIGGTHARFALARIGHDGVIALGEAVTFQTRDHATFGDAWQAFADRCGGSLPAAAAIAIAGPVSGDEIRFTNNPWTIRPSDLGRALGLDRFTLVNDFAAVAHAVARAQEDDLVHLCGPDVPLPASGVISIVGPGTGLGVGWLRQEAGGGYHAQATEGGHIAFAPLDAIDDAILARLRLRHDRVSAERVVSGPGIIAIYETLAALEPTAVEPLDDRTIWQRGLDGTDRLCASAIERFCLSLGSVAGDVALVQGAGAVVIAGGLGLRLAGRLAASGFADRFIAKGRFEGLMAAMPVKLITHPQPGLFGAAAAFAQKHLR